MRYRANTRLKGAPKHLAPAAITEERLLTTAKILAGYSTIPQTVFWDDLTPVQQRSWLADAEQALCYTDEKLAMLGKYAAYRNAMQALPPVDDDPYW